MPNSYSTQRRDVVTVVRGRAGYPLTFRVRGADRSARAHAGAPTVPLYRLAWAFTCRFLYRLVRLYAVFILSGALHAVFILSSALCADSV